MPGNDDKEDGGHAMLCCGFDDNKQVFIIRNSWGPNLGDQGYYYIPYAYMINNNLVDDCWTIRTVV